MENKYYTPGREDIRIGYECEIWWNYNYLPENEWCKIISFIKDTEDFDLFDFTERISKNQIRTSFLTKEQIEADGWEYHEDSFLARRPNYNPTHFWFTRNGFGLTFYNGGRVQITDDRENTTFPNIVFDSILPSINELRYICKLLKIK